MKSKLLNECLQCFNIKIQFDKEKRQTVKIMLITFHEFFSSEINFSSIDISSEGIERSIARGWLNEEDFLRAGRLPPMFQIFNPTNNVDALCQNLGHEYFTFVPFDPLCQLWFPSSQYQPFFPNISNPFFCWYPILYKFNGWHLILSLLLLNSWDFDLVFWSELV